jgi:hypothetical protein
MTTAPDTPDRDEPPREQRGIDGWMHRYSRWKRRRLVSLNETSVAVIGIRTLYLCACILLDGVMLPWAVVVLVGAFSYPLFAGLVLPAIVVEALLYQRMKAVDREPA